MSPVDAPAAENLTVLFEEIAGRRDFLQQARIFVSWDAPYGQWNQGKMGVVAGLVPLCTGPSRCYAMREDKLTASCLVLLLHFQSLLHFYGAIFLILPRGAFIAVFP